MSEIKELRNDAGLTQTQVAEMVGISLRSYKSYENDPEKRGTIKYNYILEKLQEYLFTDEEHGILEMKMIVDKCTGVLKEYAVDYCIVFGSYAKGKATETSDIDLLVASEVRGIKFYEMVEWLRTALHKRVDVFTIEQLRDNLELTNEILKYGIKIYDQGDK